jgi:hypothetical protein
MNPAVSRLDPSRLRNADMWDLCPSLGLLIALERHYGRLRAVVLPYLLYSTFARQEELLIPALLTRDLLYR